MVAMAKLSVRITCNNWACEKATVSPWGSGVLVRLWQPHSPQQKSKDNMYTKTRVIIKIRVGAYTSSASVISPAMLVFINSMIRSLVYSWPKRNMSLVTILSSVQS